MGRRWIWSLWRQASRVPRIAWALLTISKSADHGNAPSVLRAYNAETLEELWNSEQNVSRDDLGTLVDLFAHSGEWEGLRR